MCVCVCECVCLLQLCSMCGHGIRDIWFHHTQFICRFPTIIFDVKPLCHLQYTVSPRQAYAVQIVVNMILWLVWYADYYNGDYIHIRKCILVLRMNQSNQTLSGNQATIIIKYTDYGVTIIFVAPEDILIVFLLIENN